VSYPIKFFLYKLIESIDRNITKTIYTDKRPPSPPPRPIPSLPIKLLQHQIMLEHRVVERDEHQLGGFNKEDVEE